MTEWTPITLEELSNLIKAAEAQMDDEVRHFWQLVRIEPVKWSEPDYGDEGDGFWAVGIIGSCVIWYNDIEDGFNVSKYESYGHIGTYWCNQDPLDICILQLNRLARSGTGLIGRGAPAQLRKE